MYGVRVLEVRRGWEPEPCGVKAALSARWMGFWLLQFADLCSNVYWWEWGSHAVISTALLVRGALGKAVCCVLTLLLLMWGLLELEWARLWVDAGLDWKWWVARDQVKGHFFPHLLAFLVRFVGESLGVLFKGCRVDLPPFFRNPYQTSGLALCNNSLSWDLMNSDSSAVCHLALCKRIKRIQSSAGDSLKMEDAF